MKVEYEADDVGSDGSAIEEGVGVAVAGATFSIEWNEEGTDARRCISYGRPTGLRGAPLRG